MYSSNTGGSVDPKEHCLLAHLLQLVLKVYLNSNLGQLGLWAEWSVSGAASDPPLYLTSFLPNVSQLIPTSGNSGSCQSNHPYLLCNGQLYPYQTWPIANWKRWTGFSMWVKEGELDVRSYKNVNLIVLVSSKLLHLQQISCQQSLKIT